MGERSSKIGEWVDGEWVDEKGYISMREIVVGELTYAPLIDLYQVIMSRDNAGRTQTVNRKGKLFTKISLPPISFIVTFCYHINISQGAQTRFIRLRGSGWKLDGHMWLGGMPDGVPRTAFEGDKDAFFEDYIAMKLRYM